MGTLLQFFQVSYAASPEKIVLAKEEREWLKQNPHIKLAASSMQPPFSMKDNNGKLDGIMRDIFDYLSQSIGQEIEFELYDVNTDLHAHANQEGLYGVASIFITEENKKDYLFTDAYLNTPFYLITTKKNRSFINDLNDLKGNKVAVPQGSRAIDELLDAIGNIK